MMILSPRPSFPVATNSPATAHRPIRVLRRTVRPLGLLVLFGLSAQAAVDFTVSPATISNTFPGTITVTITGLNPGQGARLSKYRDANGNGQIDPGEPLVANFALRDGQVATIGGVRLTTVPGDEDLSSNGVIRVEFPLGRRSELEGVAGAYLYQVWHGTSAFPAVVRPFTVTPASYGQAFSGTILSDGSAVPGAGVVALAGPDGEFVTGVTADAQGRYSLSLPPGTYQLVVFRDGYVCDFSQMPVLSLAAGQTITTNLPMTPATHTLSGQVRVEGTTNLLPGLQAFFQASSGQFALGYTDINGNFNVGVTLGVWGIEPNESVTAAHGLLFPRNQVQVDASTGSVSGLQFELPRATALVYGSVKDNLNNPIPYLRTWCDGQGIPLGSAGWTDGNGNFSVGATAGNWSVGFDDQALAAGGLILQSANVTLADGQAQRLDFVALHATAHLRGFVRKPDGSPLPDLSLLASSAGAFSSVRSGSDGSFNLAVTGGFWTIQLEENDARAAGVLGPSLDVNVTDGVDQDGILVIARPITARITGRVTATSGTPFAGLQLWAQADYAVTNRYFTFASTDALGNYAVAVSDGTWSMGLDCMDLQNRGYPCPSPATLTVAGADQVHDFVLDNTPTPPSFGVPNVTGGQFRCTVSGQPGRNYRIWATADLVNWVELGIYPGPSFEFTDAASGGSHRCYGAEVVP